MRANFPVAPAVIWRGPPMDRNDARVGGAGESQSGGGMNSINARNRTLLTGALTGLNVARGLLGDSFVQGPSTARGPGRAERAEGKGRGGEVDGSRGGGGGNHEVDLARARFRDSFGTGPLSRAGGPAPTTGVPGIASALAGTDTDRAARESPLEKLLGVFQKLLEALKKKGERDDASTSESKSGGGMHHADLNDGATRTA